MVHAGWVHRLLPAADGRQMPGPDSSEVSLKCQRIIEQLALLGIRYVREPTDSERGAQDVRPLNEVLSWRLATCLDMCVTFCCAALDAGVYPMILTLKRGEREHQQRHAIVLVPVNASWSVGCPVRLEEGFAREPFLDEDFRIEDLVASDPERAQSWLAIDAQQATTPPGGSPGDWAKALAKGAEYLRTWQWDVCVDVGGLRATTMLDDASAPEVKDPSVILLPGYLPLAEGVTPLQLLRTRSGVVPFCPRQELNQLRDWARTASGTSKDSDRTGADLAVALVTGAGGCGKTRLAAELCHSLSTLGWCAGFLPARADLSDAELAEFSKLTTELLIVVDYAEESRQEQLRRLLRALAARRSPTRLVLTARGANVWWEQFRENMEEDGVRLGPMLPVTLDQRLKVPELLYRRAARAFAKAMDSSLPADLPSPERAGRTTLDIVLQAWLTALPKKEADAKKASIEKPSPTRADLYERVLEAEFGRWREEARGSGLTIISKAHHRRAAAVLTILAPAPDAEAVDEVLSRLPEWSNEHLLRSRYAELLEETLLHGAGDGGVALQPDPVAEHLILQVCRKAPELLDEVLPQDPLTVPGLEDPEADDLVVARALALREQAERCCAVITRAADLDSERALILARRVLAARPHLWRAALRVSLAQGGPFVRALEELVTSGADLPLAEIDEAIPLGHSWLRNLGVAVAQRLTASAGDDPIEQARVLNNLAIRLSEAGHWDEALRAAQEAATFYRVLAEVNEAAYTPDLAASLSNLAVLLSRAGCRDEALQVAQEATGLYQQLAEVNEAAYTPDLAASLNNLAIRLSEAGHWDEALRAAQEATGLYQQLAEVNEAAYTPDLAASLNNLAIRLSEAGRRDEALRAAQEAVGLRRVLAEVNEVAYTPDLAASLSNLASRLSEAGHWDEALQAAQQAVDLRRDLASVNASVYTPNLASSLSNLAAFLSRAGCRDEALQTAQEAASLYRVLVEASSASYIPDLAVSLSNLAVFLSEVGCRDEALRAAQQAVDLRRDLASVNASVYTPNLASSLSNLAAFLSRAGCRDEALRAAQEATGLYQQLAEVNKVAYNPDLASSLNNLANRLSEVGCRDEALRAAQEAKDLYRSLVESNATAYTPNLAASLSNLANRLSEVGCRDEALRAAQEATGLYQQLAEVNEAAYTPDLAASLNNLANRLSEAGRRNEALQAAQEAATLYRVLVEVNEAAYTPDLAASLNNLAIRLSEAGRRDEALRAAQEAVGLRRVLAEVNEAAYTPNLAASLNNLASRLSEAGRRDEALRAAQQATGLYQQLAEVNKVAYTLDLAASLNNLASRLSEAGRRDEALRAAQQATGLYQQLAEVNKVAYTLDLAASLNNLASRLSEAGRRDEALRAAQQAATLRRSLVEANEAAYAPDFARSLTKLADILSEVGRCKEALEVFTTNTEHLSSAARAYLLLARARWRGSEGAEDVVVAAQEANKDDDPRFLGPCRREIAAALREHGLTNEDLPIWAVVIVDESLRQCLETWLNCDSPAEQATYLESEWNSPTPSDCETLDALTDLFIDVPPISVLHQYVTQVKNHGIDEIASLLRSQDLAITLTKEWLAEHRRSRGGQYLRNHPTLLTDSRLADLVPQALKNLTSADEAATLTALLDLARLSDPEIAYAVTNADDAVDALADLLGRGKWRAILAALVLNPSLANHMSLGVLAEVLRAAAAGETGKAEVRLQGARESVSSFHIEQLRLLLSQALLHEDCPSGFSDLLDLLNDSSRASSS